MARTRHPGSIQPTEVAAGRRRGSRRLRWSPSRSRSSARRTPCSPSLRRWSGGLRRWISPLPLAAMQRAREEEGGWGMEVRPSQTLRHSHLPSPAFARFMLSTGDHEAANPPPRHEHPGKRGGSKRTYQPGVAALRGRAVTTGRRASATRRRPLALRRRAMATGKRPLAHGRGAMATGRRPLARGRRALAPPAKTVLPLSATLGHVSAAAGHVPTAANPP